MPTLEELLKQHPEQLNSFLSSVPRDINAPVPQADINKEAMSQLLPPTQGMGPVSDPEQYQALLSANPPMGSSDSTEDSEQPSSHTPASSVPKVSTPSSSPMTAMNQQMMDASHTDTMNTVAGLKTAQDKANKEIALNNLNKAASMIQSGATAIAHKTKAPDISENVKFFDEQNKQAQQGVQQYKDLTEQEKNDPNSAASAKMRSISQPMLQKIGIKLPDNMSFNEIEKNFPMFTKMYDIQQQTEARKELAKESAANRSLTRELSLKDKENASKDKALQGTQQLLESARGNPAAAQAEKDLYASKKADSLFNRYKDPNQMNSAEVQLYATEIAKMASGGVPSIHELQGLNPSTVPSELAKVAQTMSNKPTPANAAEFLKRYKAYSDSLAKDAQQVIEDKYSRVIEGRKKQLGDEGYKALKEQYIDRFKNPQGQTPASDTVRVQTPDGKTGTIPRSQLATALSRGFKEIQ